MDSTVIYSQSGFAFGGTGLNSGPCNVEPHPQPFMLWLFLRYGPAFCLVQAGLDHDPPILCFPW
jgi:hypothetical protein